jgi:hypothetical protein
MRDDHCGHIPGGCFFFTVVTMLTNRGSRSAELTSAFATGFRRTRAKHPLRIDAILTLPDHLHSKQPRLLPDLPVRSEPTRCRASILIEQVIRRLHPRDCEASGPRENRRP